jgi:hypothetical protein
MFEDYKMKCCKCNKLIGKYKAYCLPEMILCWTCIDCLRKDLED